MSLTVIFILALVQGLTEFLPVSSSAHLILAGQALGADQGLAFDVAAHVGTLVAVLVYFRRELGRFAAGILGGGGRDAVLAGQLALATLPVAIAGLLFHDVVAGRLRGPEIIAAATIAFGLLLWWADRQRGEARDEYALTWKTALLIGLAQAIALVPGTSRSGITMTAALLLGLSRRAAARVSFLLAIPALALAGGYEAWQVAGQQASIHWREFLLAAAFSGLAAFACIHLFLGWIERVGFTPFVLYRLALGLVLLLAI